MGYSSKLLYGVLLGFLCWANTSAAGDRIYNLNHKLKFFVTDELDSIKQRVAQDLDEREIHLDLNNFECLGALSEEHGVVGVCALRALTAKQVQYSVQVLVKNSLNTPLEVELDLLRLSPR
jgi:hypothetical protein